MEYEVEKILDEKVNGNWSTIWADSFHLKFKIRIRIHKTNVIQLSKQILNEDAFQNMCLFFQATFSICPCCRDVTHDISNLCYKNDQLNWR